MRSTSESSDQSTLINPDPAILVTQVDVVSSLTEKEEAVSENPLKNVYFGETHVHTSFSLDAYIGGNRLSPNNAYRFSKGGTVSLNGLLRSIVKPLDFVAVTDHAEFLGEMYSTQVEGAQGHLSPALVKLRNLEGWEDQEA